MPQFQRYFGIYYSGAETPSSIGRPMPMTCMSISFEFAHHFIGIEGGLFDSLVPGHAPAIRTVRDKVHLVVESGFRHRSVDVNNDLKRKTRWKCRINCVVLQGE